MDVYLKKAKLVLFVDSFDGRGVDLSKCTDLTLAFLRNRMDVVGRVRGMESGWLYLQRGVVDDFTISQVSYFCDGFVEYKFNGSNVECKWWFKTSSTKVVHSQKELPKRENGGLELLEERHAREKDKVELNYTTTAGFDSDDPDADLDI
jgi:hypothetical protein